MSAHHRVMSIASVTDRRLLHLIRRGPDQCEWCVHDADGAPPGHGSGTVLKFLPSISGGPFYLINDWIGHLEPGTNLVEAGYLEQTCVTVDLAMANVMNRVDATTWIMAYSELRIGVAAKKRREDRGPATSVQKQGRPRKECAAAGPRKGCAAAGPRKENDVGASRSRAEPRRATAVVSVDSDDSGPDMHTTTPLDAATSRPSRVFQAEFQL